MFKHAQFSAGLFYNVALLTDEECNALLEKIRKEKWTWVYNGLVLPHEDVGEFKLKRGPGHPDVVMLLCRNHQDDIPLMG